MLRPGKADDEIYSQFSKANALNKSDYDTVLEKMQQNEFIPRETFEAFMAKQMGLRPGKRMQFPVADQFQNQRDLLDSYLTVMRDRERQKLELKKQKLEQERQQLEEAARQAV